jgi:hypothetical protein
VRACLCGCRGDQVCQQNCINSDDTCAGCLYDAATACCPAEAAAVQRCIDQHMCVDDACVLANCGTEQSAFQACFMRLQTSAPMCQAQVRTCLGPDYPAVRCP